MPNFVIMTQEPTPIWPFLLLDPDLDHHLVFLQSNAFVQTHQVVDGLDYVSHNVLGLGLLLSCHG